MMVTMMMNNSEDFSLCLLFFKSSCSSDFLRDWEEKWPPDFCQCVPRIIIVLPFYLSLRYLSLSLSLLTAADCFITVMMDHHIYRVLLLLLPLSL